MKEIINVYTADRVLVEVILAVLKQLSSCKITSKRLLRKSPEKNSDASTVHYVHVCSMKRNCVTLARTNCFIVSAF